MRKKSLDSRWKRLLALCIALCAMTGGCRGSQWPLWKAYQGRFIDAQGRVFDPVGDQRSTSEGEAYALFFSLVVGDRASFDRILNWTQENLAEGDLGAHLPAWLWGKAADGSWKRLDPSPASDADVWLAYTLAEAGRLWNVPAYTHLSQRLTTLIGQKEVADLPGFGPMLLPGPVGFAHGKSWTLNPSYLPVSLFERLARLDPAGPWRAVAERIPLLVQSSARHGYAMDWVEYRPGDGFAPATMQGPAAVNQQGGTSLGSYDAIRVYLWAGMMPAGAVRQAMLDAVPGMGVYLATHDLPPEKVTPDGLPGTQAGPVGFSAALVPYLHGYPDLSKASAKQWLRLNSEKDSSGLYGKNLAYYDQNLVLFATGFMEDRFHWTAEGELRVKWKR